MEVLNKTVIRVVLTVCRRAEGEGSLCVLARYGKECVLVCERFLLGKLRLEDLGDSLAHRVGTESLHLDCGSVVVSPS